MKETFKLPDEEFRNQGRRLVREADNVLGTIVAVRGDRYIIRWDDETDGHVMLASLEAADKAHLQSLVSGRSRDEIIKSVGVTHRELHKPAKASSLRSSEETDGILANALPLDPKAPDFDERVARAIRTGRVKAPTIETKKAPAKADRGAEIHKQMTTVDKAKSSKANNGATIAVAYRHTPIGGRGND